MSYEALLVHTCDIYHLRESTSGGGYGVPGEKTYYYPEEPDLTGVPCYVYKGSLRTVQGTPGSKFVETMQVQFLPTADVRVNDKMVFNGIKYKLYTPVNIRDHHIEVTVERDDYL